MIASGRGDDTRCDILEVVKLQTTRDGDACANSDRVGANIYLIMRELTYKRIANGEVNRFHDTEVELKQLFWL